MRARRGAAAVATVVALTLAACDGAGGGGAGAEVGVQISHPNGVVLQIDSVRVGGEATVVQTRVFNGRGREISLNAGRENTYLLTDAGEKLLLAPPAANTAFSIPAGRSIDAALVFSGALPRGERATLVINEQSRSDNAHTSSPGFQTVLPLNGAYGARDVPKVSGFSGMRPNAASRLGPATAAGSSLGVGGSRATSSLQVVEALRTELGAVRSARGDVVSLPADVTFDFDKATVRREGRAALDTLARLIQASGGDGAINIEGHTDSRGDEAYNLDLSKRRAEAVKDYLVQKGVDRRRLRTVGLGEQRPVAPNARPGGSDDEAGRQRNRRVEVILPEVQAAAPAPAPTNGGSVSRLEPAA